MTFSFKALSVLLAASAAGVNASPLQKRQTSALKPTDAEILNYALTLEHLEATFYRQGLANFTAADFSNAGYSSDFYKQIQTVAQDEATHVTFLTSALEAVGIAAIPECSYSFGVTDVHSFIATASVLEGVGVSAYLGAAAFIDTKAYLTAAASILTVEARHSAFLRYSGLQENPYPSPFDVPLDFDGVFTLAGQFITSCPTYAGPFPPIPGITGFPLLSFTSTSTPIMPGDTVTLVTKSVSLQPQNNSTVLYAAWMTSGTPNFVVATPTDDSGTMFRVPVPEGTAGQSYVYLTACNSTLTDSDILAGPALIEIGD